MKKTKKELTIEEKREKNRKILVLYRTLSVDLLFFYAISYLFLTNVKGFTSAQVVFADSFYPLAKLSCQIPFTIVVQKIGKKRALVIASLGIFFYVLATTFAFSVALLVLANLFLGVAYTFKGLCDSTIVYDSLENDGHRPENFSKFESKALSIFYLLDSVTSLATGFLYIVSPYLPLIICLCIEAVVVLVASRLYDIPEEVSQVETKEKKSFKQDLKDILSNLAISFKFIFKSSRLHSLIIYHSLFGSLLTLMVTLRRSLLADVNVSSEYFGIIFTVLGIVASVASSKSFAIHQKYRNRTLTFLGISFSISIIISGLVLMVKMPIWLMYYLLLLMFATQYILKGPFYTLIKQYLNSFSNNELRLKIYSANSLIEYVVSTIITFSCSFLLTMFTNAQATLIVGCFALFAFIGLLIYMLDKVGLKPEQYKKEDIDYSYLK